MTNSKFQDETINCVQCQFDFTWTGAEQRYYAERQLNRPKRCTVESGRMGESVLGGERNCIPAAAGAGRCHRSHVTRAHGVAGLDFLAGQIHNRG